MVRILDTGDPGDVVGTPPPVTAPPPPSGGGGGGGGGASGGSGGGERHAPRRPAQQHHIQPTATHQPPPSQQPSRRGAEHVSQPFHPHPTGVLDPPWHRHAAFAAPATGASASPRPRTHADPTRHLLNHVSGGLTPQQIRHGLDEGRPASIHPGHSGIHQPSRAREAFALAEAHKIRKPEDFAIVLLTYMGLPVNKRNVGALLQWESTEGGHWKGGASPKYGGYHNPLNTDYLYAGGKGDLKTPGASRPNPTATPAAQYPTWKLGVEATAFTLREHQFAPELNALRHSQGGAALRAAVASTPSYGTIASRWTTSPIGIYAYSNYRKSPFFYTGR